MTMCTRHSVVGLDLEGTLAGIRCFGRFRRNVARCSTRTSRAFTALLSSLDDSPSSVKAAAVALVFLVCCCLFRLDWSRFTPTQLIHVPKGVNGKVLEEKGWDSSNQKQDEPIEVIPLCPEEKRESHEARIHKSDELQWAQWIFRYKCIYNDEVQI